MLRDEKRWTVTIVTDNRDEVVVNSIDGDPKNVKLSVMGHVSVIVSLADMMRLLKRVDAHTTGIAGDTSAEKLTQLAKAASDIEAVTTCPDPAEGGCIGGPVPGLGCVHEAARYMRRELTALKKQSSE